MTQPERREDYQIPIPSWKLHVPIEWDRYTHSARLAWIHEQVQELIHLQRHLERGEERKPA